ncbi:alpha/beta fold hydrolase [Gottfriedia sp. NPDC057948]|uniref:alpha/beta fold hydrolase n=1 Tax=Gottfriedia sp. NPDC057948 TaxID=3346287 RepID=UPI0036D8D005
MYSFEELAIILVNKFHLIVFDHPGHGKTTAFDNEEDYLFSNLSNWYNKVFEQEITKPFFLMGHSWGAEPVTSKFTVLSIIKAFFKTLFKNISIYKGTSNINSCNITD